MDRASRARGRAPPYLGRGRPRPRDHRDRRSRRQAGRAGAAVRETEGSTHPLLINQFGTERRMCLALGVDKLDDAAAKLGDVLDMQRPGSRREGQGPAQAEVGRGLAPEDGLQGRLPGDRPPGRRRRPRPAPDPALLARRSRAVHHAPRRHHEGPEDRCPQRRHVPHAGRRQELDLHALADAQGRTSRLARLRGRADPGCGRIGLDPVSAYAASAPLPHHLDELMLAGFLRGEPVELVRCKTIDLEVPANAEIVLEGHVSKDDVGIEGPFGDHTATTRTRSRFRSSGSRR